MQIQAVSLGSRVPRHSFRASIQSVFNSAINLKVPGEEVLLTLLVSDSLDLPQGIRIQTAAGFSTRDIYPGQAVYCEGGVLYLPGEIFSVDIRSARVWDCETVSADFASGSGPKKLAWQTAHNACRADRQSFQACQMPAALWQARIKRELRNLADAAQCLDMQKTEQAASALIGLGAGLTPSGDDLLVGFMAGLWAIARQTGARRNFAQQFSQILIRLSSKTNEISRTFLILAAQGQFSSSLLTLEKAICLGAAPQSVCQAADELLQFGHTSGKDLATGLLAGLAVWDKTLQSDDMAGANSIDQIFGVENDH